MKPGLDCSGGKPGWQLLRLPGFLVAMNFSYITANESIIRNVVNAFTVVTHCCHLPSDVEGGEIRGARSQAEYGRLDLMVAETQ
jgi:hypothetical protein